MARTDPEKVGSAAHVRKWALWNGYDDVPARGKLRAELIEAYNAAHPEHPHAVDETRRKAASE